MGGPYKTPSLVLTANEQLTTTRGQYRSIGMEGRSTPLGGDPPDEAYDLAIDSESLTCTGGISDLSTCVIWEI